MATTKLVGRFERSQTENERNEQHQLPPPQPARFLPGTDHHSAVFQPDSPAVFSSTTITAGNHIMNTHIQIPHQSLTRRASSGHAFPSRDDGDLQPLIPKVAAPQKVISSRPSRLARHRHDESATSTLVNPSPARRRLHKPVPATTIFARNAAPLLLPKLDEYLTSLPAPPFAQKGSKKEPIMFPPMHHLAGLQKSIDDLEANMVKPPFWKDSKPTLSSAVNAVIGVMGSSALAPFYSLQGLFNTVQIFALLLSTIIPINGNIPMDKWKQLFLGTIPNVLAFNFASTLMRSLFFLVIFMAVAAALLYRFWRSTLKCDRYKAIEGLQKTDPQGSKWGVILVTFLLTTIYLPLSTMAVHVLVWSEDLWIVDNPYKNSTTFPPVVPPLGPADEYLDALDFCWTTTMKRNEVNFAPVIIILSVIVFSFLTIWFPVALRRVIRLSVPTVDRFTELGRPRNTLELDLEYHRLLSRDRGPFSFLYSGFRRGWGTYESTYLIAKVTTLLIIAIIDSDNCLFRSSSRKILPIVRQVLLLLSTIGFFLAQSVFAPFLDPINNASEWTSRLNYVLTAAVALMVHLNVSGKDIFDSYVLYAIYVATYGLSFYFSFINLGFMHRIIKRLTRRLDFSVDIFSPRLDTTPSSPHLKRRIWQESITTLILTAPTCKIPEKQFMKFAQARDSEYPPYLLAFAGSPAERHVENLKILREVGSFIFTRAVTLSMGPDSDHRKRIVDIIQNQLVGPDAYWSDPDNAKPKCTNFFGNAWWIPFPPTLVIKYDEGPLAAIQESAKLDYFVQQNLGRPVQRKRQIRMSLRALDKKLVHWPYEHIEPIGSQNIWCCGNRYDVSTHRSFYTGLLSLERRGDLDWKGLHCGSGFRVSLEYSRDIKVSGEIIGINEDFDLTPQLARFLDLNQELIDVHLPRVEDALSDYRRHHWKEAVWKNHVLSYGFLSHIYDHPQTSSTVIQYLLDNERDIRIRDLFLSNEIAVDLTFQRFNFIMKSEAATWWYLFWDDLWRRNFRSLSALRTHEKDFNPHYSSSIAYIPLPRKDLERFLSQKGLWASKPSWNHYFTPGFLNKIYSRLNQTVFRQSNRAIHFHFGDGHQEYEMDDLDTLARAPGSTVGIGGGTNHDDSAIRPRPIYRWEGMLDDPVVSQAKKVQKRLFAKFGAWFGITPLWRETLPTHGVSLDVELLGGAYVLIADDLIQHPHVT